MKKQKLISLYIESGGDITEKVQKYLDDGWRITQMMGSGHGNRGGSFFLVLFEKSAYEDREIS